jgi:NuA3 HAT complex component NTO1
MPSVEGQDEPADESTGNKRKRGQATPIKTWRLPSGAPVVPELVFKNVEHSLGNKFPIRKRKEFIQEACKYWTLKREARRGAALLKRLQLQMEAFSSMEITRRNFAGMGAAGGPRLQRRIEFAERLEDDMEQIRVFCQLVKQREEKKLEDVMLLRDIVNCIYFPIPNILQPVLDKAQR